MYLLILRDSADDFGSEMQLASFPDLVGLGPGNGLSRQSRIARFATDVVATVLLAALFVFLVEAVSRGSAAAALGFLFSTDTAGWATVLFIAVILLALDAIVGRTYLALCALGPLFLILPFINLEKQHYLSDPLFPTDFLFARQVFDIAPLIVDQRPLMAVAAAAGVLLAVGLLVAGIVFGFRRFPRTGMWSRALRLAIAVPALLFFYSISDYSTYSWARDRLDIIPMMWDQKANYDHNGFIMAFALNVPMSDVAAPAGYGAARMKGMQPHVALSGGTEKPDVIVVMNESFWDPTRLPGVKITPDPMPTIRGMQSGYMFSPEFGGMTADIEFEALTGFSNAFLPYGSIPYQQDIHRPMPSLARFFKGQGYETRGIHPYQAWFWNRGSVYRDFGFDVFMSEEKLPPIRKRGDLASDEALTDEVIREANSMTKPFFYYVVTLQNHGPYEPHRYRNTHVKVAAPGMSEDSRQSLLSYAEGVHDADAAFAKLVDWAKKRSRPTILVFFGDHLPPLSAVYVESGFLKNNTPPRKAPIADMLSAHRTPLVIWSNRTGSVDTGTISPSLIPQQILKLAGMTHPYYTGFLGEVRDRYRVIDRQLLLNPDGRTGNQNWVEKKRAGPVVDEFRLLQYDMMFGKQYSRDAFFPTMEGGKSRNGPKLVKTPSEPPVSPS